MRIYTSIGIEKSIALGFLSLILAGTLSLWIVNNIGTRPLMLIDALFISTSAVCVTGLASVDVGTVLTVPSQIILLVLIQLGGLGIMTALTALPLILGKRIGLRERLSLAGGFGEDSPNGMILLLVKVLQYTLAIEFAGGVVLFLGFVIFGETWGRALYLAAFHAVSAFCNAGFSTYSNNLAPFAQTFIVPFAVMTLITLGGLGFPIIVELHQMALRKRTFLTAYAKTVLTTTALLLFGGGLILAFAEWNHSFSSLPAWAKLWNGIFGSVTARTAGFEMVSYSTWSAHGIVLTMFLMIVGASPASTGGGMKTTTFAVLLWAALSEIKDADEVVLWGRSIASKTIRRALALACFYFLTIFLATSLLSYVENISFPKLLFEVVSALGTVGLSMNVTPQLSHPGKLIIVIMMYWGRIGLVTFLYTLIRHEKPANVHYPAARMPIG